MLRLENIKKDYYVADTVVNALKGINLSFRKNEFVSILGPSGCGKTTLLNIIGGLDKYSDGDLFINGKSTKEFKDADWDVYRNHRIGFIFQSYNLIPHQTILGNVELALTIAGISKDERIARAKAAIDKVGLKGQYYKHPNQLSGGQCQRVAIARALVNEPEILLADEPTGALDTVTSVQIMDLIREIAKDKLVIMVTHNPELAEQYSTRIVRLLDGELQSDSNPFSKEEEIYETKVLNEELKKEQKVAKKKEKAKMSLWTSFKLSARNLLSKRARTMLTCFAGSIGIIGVSSVLAVSSGVKGYIKSMQDDMLSGNPITIQETALDIDSMMSNMAPAQKIEVIKEAGKVNVEFAINQMLEQYENIGKITVNNTITQDYIDYIYTMSDEYAACITLNYGLDMTYNIYTDFAPSVLEGESTEVGRSLASIRTNYASVLSHVEGLGDYSSIITNLVECFKQAPSNEEYIASQYNILSGKIATKKNEVMIVLDKDSQMTDLVLAELGYFTQDDFVDICIEAKEDPKNDHSNIKNKFTYEEILGKTFRWYDNDSIVVKHESTGPNDQVSHNYLYDESMIDGEGLELKVVGILEPKETISYGCLTTGFYYTEELTKYALEKNKESELVKYITEQGGTLSSGNSMMKGGDFGAIYKYSYVYDGTEYTDVTGFLGNENALMQLGSAFGDMMGSMPGMGAMLQNMKTFDLTLREAGGSDIANSVSIYPVNFELKDGVTAHLDKWNSDDVIIIGDKVLTKADREKVTYTDSVGVIINLVNTLIDIITYALIAFTALSLVVSCVMIAIITYVSVMERVKEIGVIRSLGGSKRNVTNLFNAETFIIGLTSGLFGVGFTYVMQTIANAIIGHFSGVYTIADLPLSQAAIMVGLSILLTCVSGLIPARSAAKKDPVVALRTE